MGESPGTRRRVAALTIASCLALSVAHVASANEFAFGWVLAGSPIYTGFLGTAELRTDPPTVSGVGYVHPVQMDIGSLGGDFVAVGTANGMGTNDGPVYNCANHYDARWDIYTDGVIGGIYECHDNQVNAFVAPSSQAFKIDWRFCTGDGANRWVMRWNSHDQLCLNSSSHAATWFGAGLETSGASTTDRNIDVRYWTMQYLLSGGSWANLGFVSNNLDPSYSFSNPVTTNFNTYLAPLD